MKKKAVIRPDKGTTISIFGSSIYGVYFDHLSGKIIILTPESISISGFGPDFIDLAWTKESKKEVLTWIFRSCSKIFDEKDLT